MEICSHRSFRWEVLTFASWIVLNKCKNVFTYYINNLVQVYSNSIANVLELPQSYGHGKSITIDI